MLYLRRAADIAVWQSMTKPMNIKILYINLDILIHPGNPKKN